MVAKTANCLNNDIAKELGDLATIFSGPLPRSEIENGWTQETWLRWGANFCRLSKQFSAGESLPDASISRAMDFDGIAGPLKNRAARLSNMLRQIRSRQ